MIPNITKKDAGAGGLAHYLIVHKGHHNEHRDQTIVAGSQTMPLGPAGPSEARWVAAEIQSVRDKYGAGTWHASLAIPPADGIRTDAEWAEISREFMTEMFGDLDGIRWAAVRHGTSAEGNDHVHVLCADKRDDGTPLDVKRDYPRAQAACGRIERGHGLTAPPKRLAQAHEEAMAENADREQAVAERQVVTPAERPDVRLWMVQSNPAMTAQEVPTRAPSGGGGASVAADVVMVASAASEDPAVRAALMLLAVMLRRLSERQQQERRQWQRAESRRQRAAERAEIRRQVHAQPEGFVTCWDGVVRDLVRSESGFVYANVQRPDGTWSKEKNGAAKALGGERWSAAANARGHQTVREIQRAKRGRDVNEGHAYFTELGKVTIHKSAKTGHLYPKVNGDYPKAKADRAAAMRAAHAGQDLGAAGEAPSRSRTNDRPDPLVMGQGSNLDLRERSAAERLRYAAQPPADQVAALRRR